MAGDSDSPSVITDGLPWLTPDCSLRWLGRRVVYWPNGIPGQRRISVVSSRLRERLDLETRWFDLLRTTALRCDPATEALCAVDDSAAFEATVRASELFGRPLIRFHVPSTEAVLAETETDEWLSRVVERLTADSSRQHADHEPLLRIAVVSPELFRPERMPTDSQWSGISLADRLLFAAASRLHVLACRSGGNIASLLELHCHDEERKHVPLLIASDKHGRMPETVRDLADGWVPWLVQPFLRDAEAANDDSDILRAAIPEVVASTSRRVVPCLDSNPLSHPSEWLLHWTRPARGPWPGETRTDFLDSLILGCESTDRSALATLLRIVAEGVLRGSSEGIRGGHVVVSFTQIPLRDFRDRRVFRKHRRRFDFEPWGLAIRRDVLESNGIRPVIYGHDQDWSNLPSEEQSFFQKATSGGPTDNLGEQEWRVASDLDLRSLPPESVCVFVDTDDAAEIISRHCDWPVVVVPIKPDTSRQR